MEPMRIWNIFLLGQGAGEALDRDKVTLSSILRQGDLLFQALSSHSFPELGKLSRC